MSPASRVWSPGESSESVTKVERVHEFREMDGSKNILDSP
jgi:hypothetical protein